MRAARNRTRRSGRALRVLLLTHESLVPPRSARAPRAGHRPPPWATEQAVERTLVRAGHAVRWVGLHDELVPLDEALDGFRPAVVFNLLEEFDDQTRKVAHVVAYLEALGYPVTGCSAEGLVLAGDKALARTLLATHGVTVPEGFVVPRGRAPRPPHGLGFPLVVKSVTDHGSAGLSQASVVRTGRGLRGRVQALHRTLGTDALVERYVEGRELYVTVLDGRRPLVAPPWELFRTGPRRRRPWVATARVKEEGAAGRRAGFAYARAAPLPPELRRAVTHTVLAAYAALRLTGPARVDLRLPPGAGPVVLEVNPNPDLFPRDEVARSMRAAGVPYGALLTRILHAALARPRR